ncbi:prenyltransferase/squalene oxidase repeat-containing protein [Streptomyces luteireticuli]|uniref:Squalene--hopene cyclase n=1 Tax=Streptomyces luteireticuli TaxID=173858 RepID=A0ABN0YHD9_9ACTN
MATTGTTGDSRAPVPARGARSAHDAARTRLLGLQRQDGSWEGEMEWNTTGTAQYVIVMRILERPLDEATRRGLVQHFRSARSPGGGWALHPQGPPSPYATTLAYLALRLLGAAPTDPLTAEAAAWLRALPGAPAVPQWGTFWLALLGLVPYEDLAPVPPEAMLLPARAPLHPSRLLGWTRMLYQAMAYLYGTRFAADLGPLAAELRHELFPHGGRTGEPLPGIDAHFPPGRALRLLTHCLRGWERVHSRGLRRAALERCHRAVADEQHASPHHGLSSANALLECLVLYARDPHHPLLEGAVGRLAYWRWTDTRRGVRICGDRSTVWDTSFAAQALLAADPGHVPDAVLRARAHLAGAQVTAYTGLVAPLRTVLGGWAFSDGNSRWPVGDCTAEALNALLDDDGSAPPPLPPHSLHAALGVLLDRQNRDGGFGTLDRQRAGRWLEALNPTEMFLGCMTDSSSVDCTGSVLTALARLRRHLDPDDRRRAETATGRAVAYLRAAQNPDGSFTGTWGIHHTYAAFLAARGLRAAGVRPDDPAPAALGRWLATTQLADGGWGENWRGCTERRHIPLDHGLPEMTSWAVLAALDTLGPRHPAVARGIRWLCDHQRPDGSWENDHVNGVSFATLMLRYPLYSAYFPTLALGRYLHATATTTPATGSPARAWTTGTGR